MMLIDLHTHSTASDGTDTPAQLIEQAAAAGLDVVAITDHDTSAGWSAAMDALPAGLTLVRGVEMSCVYAGADRPVTLHLLAYLVDAHEPTLAAEWDRLRDSRQTRGQRIVENLVAAGFPISWEQVTALADGGSVGRPHIGRALVAAGVVPDVDTAFAQVLSARHGYYVRKADTDVFDAIRMVRAAGGLPVFAHPIARRRGPIVPDDGIEAMAAAGLLGLEVDHPDYAPDDRAHAARLAVDLDLVGTGSSDYHGTNKRTPLGARVTPPEQFERLMSLPAALAPVTG